jgi:hypothetical protein
MHLEQSNEWISPLLSYNILGYLSAAERNVYSSSSLVPQKKKD